MSWGLNSSASSAARGDQSNLRGDSGVTINNGGGWQAALPLLAVVVIVALFVRRR